MVLVLGGYFSKVCKIDLNPVLFIGVPFLLFLIYVIFPIFQSIVLSLYEWDGIGEKTFVGLSNYVELYDDPDFWISLGNNMVWLVLFMLAPVIGLGLALFLNQKFFGNRLVKSLFFFPFVISQVIIGTVFVWFYDPNLGVLQSIFTAFGFAPINILGDERFATYGIIVAGLWPQVAYCMILYLTGLTNINKERVEAARLDGASGFSLLWHIILPELRPATFIAVVVTVIGALRSFDMVSIMTGGGPWGKSNVLAYFVYEQTISNYRMGYGAAISTILFLIMFVYIVLFVWRLLRTEVS